MLAMFILAVLLISLYEGLPLLKRRLWRELGAVGLLIGAAVYLGIAELWGMSTPLGLLEQLLGPIGKMTFR